jgi:hypothetical protein
MKNVVLAVAMMILVCLTGAIQRSSFVGSLNAASGERLISRDGRVMLVRVPPSNTTKLEGLLDMWRIGAPYLQTNGKFLSLDQSGPEIKLHLADTSSESSKWVIEVIGTRKPQTVPGTKGIVKGESGSKFRLSLFSGPKQGWYLAAKEPAGRSVNTTDTQPARLVYLEFQLVQDPKQALTFDYVDSWYSVGGK